MQLWTERAAPRSARVDATIGGRRVARRARNGYGWRPLEVSPSPVYGARLLSGFGAQPHRGFKSRHLRQRLKAPVSSGALRL